MKGLHVGLSDGAVNQISGVNKGWQKTSAKKYSTWRYSHHLHQKAALPPNHRNAKKWQKSTDCFIHHDIYMGPIWKPERSFLHKLQKVWWREQISKPILKKLEWLGSTLCSSTENPDFASWIVSLKTKLLASVNLNLVKVETLHPRDVKTCVF